MRHLPASTLALVLTLAACSRNTTSLDNSPDDTASGTVELAAEGQRYEQLALDGRLSGEVDLRAVDGDGGQTLIAAFDGNARLSLGFEGLQPGTVRVALRLVFDAAVVARASKDVTLVTGDGNRIVIGPEDLRFDDRDSDGFDDIGEILAGSDPDDADDRPADATAPEFAGATGATPQSASALQVTWNPATDSHTPAERIEYRVYVRLASEADFDFDTPSVVRVGGTSAVVEGLMAATAYALVVRAFDEAGNGDENTQLAQASTLDVTANRPPLFTAPSLERTSVLEGELLEVEVSAEDPEGAALSLSARLLPEGATFEDGGEGSATLRFTPSFAQGGDVAGGSRSYRVELVASDGALEATRPFEIEVRHRSQPPTIDAPARVAGLAGTAASARIVATDPDGDALVLTVDGLPARAVFEPGSPRAGAPTEGLLLLTSTHGDSGEWTLTVRAEKENDATVSATRDVVLAIEAAPWPLDNHGRGPKLSYANAAAAVAMDVNGDGRADLVRTVHQAGIEIHEGGAECTLGAGRGVDLSMEFAGRPTPADFNGDAAPDLLVAGAGPGARVLRGQADSFTEPARVGSSERYSRGWARDFDGDGDDDIALYATRPDRVELFLNNGESWGTERFTAAGQVEITRFITAVDLGDLDGDGHTDIAALHSHDDSQRRNGVQVWFGAGVSEGAVRFDEAVIFDLDVSEWGGQILVHDLDADGNDDLVVHQEERTDVVYIEGNRRSEAGFSETREWQLDSEIFAGDLNGDGIVDLAFNEFVLLGDGASGVPVRSFSKHDWDLDPRMLADITGDGRVDLLEERYCHPARGPADDEALPYFAEVAEHPNWVDGGFAPAFAGGDLDGDGLGDIVAILGGNTNELRVLRSTGGGLSALPAQSMTFDFQDVPHVGDFNGDGRGDVLILRNDQAAIVISDVLTPGATQTLPTSMIEDLHNELQIIDLDGDGRDDAVWEENTGGANVLRIAWGSANGNLLQQGLDFGAYTRVYNPCIGDFDDDGHLDIAAGVLRGRETEFRVFFGEGGRRFTNLQLPELEFDGRCVVRHRSGADELFMAPGRVVRLDREGVRSEEEAVHPAQFGSGRWDVTGDGEPDWIFNNERGIWVWSPENDGAWPVAYRGPRNIADPLLIGDYDGDGLADVAAPKDRSDALTLFLTSGW